MSDRAASTPDDDALLTAHELVPFAPPGIAPERVGKRLRAARARGLIEVAGHLRRPGTRQKVAAYRFADALPIVSAPAGGDHFAADPPGRVSGATLRARLGRSSTGLNDRLLRAVRKGLLPPPIVEQVNGARRHLYDAAAVEAWLAASDGKGGASAPPTEPPEPRADDDALVTAADYARLVGADPVRVGPMVGVAVRHGRLASRGSVRRHNGSRPLYRLGDLRAAVRLGDAVPAPGRGLLAEADEAREAELDADQDRAMRRHRLRAECPELMARMPGRAA